MKETVITDKVVVVGYARVSTEDQVDGDGLTRQKVAITEFAEKQGWQLERIFEERGVSGTALEARVALWELLDYCDHHPVHAVVVEQIDRLARDVMVCELILQKLRERKLKLYVVGCGTEDILTAEAVNPTQKLIRQFLTAVAEWDRCMIVARLQSARRRTGKLGGAPRWWKQPRARWLAYFLTRMEELGFADKEVAYALTRCGIRNQSGNPYTPGCFHIFRRRIKENPAKLQQVIHEIESQIELPDLTSASLDEAVQIIATKVRKHEKVV